MKNRKNKFKEAWQYVVESKKYIYSIIIVFFIFLLLGIIFNTPEAIMQAISEMVKKLNLEFQDLNLFQTIFSIFKNNLSVSVIGIFLGIIFGIVPLILCIMNGYVIGVIVKIVLRQEGIFEIWKLFPHGIFELPAVFISLGLGLRIGIELFGKNSDNHAKRNIVNSFKALIFFVIPLLLIAAVIEGVLMFLMK